MNATQLFEKLTILNACSEAIEWSAGKDLATAWATCHRGDWMLWLAKKVGVELRPLTGAKAACAEFARPYMTDLRSIAALDTAHAFGRGECSIADLVAAAKAAYDAAADAAAPYENYADFAADYADPVAAFAAKAAYDAAANSMAYAYDAAAAYAGFAARAATNDTAAEELARIETLRKCADEVRKHITAEMLAL